MSVDKATVAKIASLARIKMGDEELERMVPDGHEAVIHVSLTDDHPWAQAFVVIEARPYA